MVPANVYICSLLYANWFYLEVFFWCHWRKCGIQYQKEALSQSYGKTPGFLRSLRKFSEHTDIHTFKWCLSYQWSLNWGSWIHSWVNMRNLGWYYSWFRFFMENVSRMHRHLTFYGFDWIYGCQEKFRSWKKYRSKPECRQSSCGRRHPQLQDSHQFCPRWEDCAWLPDSARSTLKGSH